MKKIMTLAAIAAVAFSLAATSCDSSKDSKDSKDTKENKENQDKENKNNENAADLFLQEINSAKEKIENATSCDEIQAILEKSDAATANLNLTADDSAKIFNSEEVQLLQGLLIQKSMELGCFSAHHEVTQPQ